MIESCSPKCMLLSIFFLGGITLMVLIIESNWTSVNNRPGLELLDKNVSHPAGECLQNEQYTVVEPCHPCTDFEIKSKSVQICAKTHFKEGIKCLKSNHEVYRSCEKVAWLEEKRFWVFQFLMGTSSLLSSCTVFLRQRILDHRLMRKIQKQLASSNIREKIETMVVIDEELYLEVYKLHANHVECPVETAVSLYLINYLRNTNKVFFLSVDQPPGATSYHISLSQYQFELLAKNELNQIVSNCRLPAFLLVQENYCVAGLCAVLRQIVKASGEENKWLLGFREATMAACAEVSLWTRLCEVDLPQAVEEVFKSNLDVVTIPVHILRFEKHLEHPLRTHNLQKFDQLKENCENKILKPLYAEGFSMTLADIVILFYIHIFLQATEKSITEHIPHISKWYKLLMSESEVKHCFDIFKNYPKIFDSNSKIEYIVPEVSNSNLYRKEPKRYKPKIKIFTDQNDVDSLIQMIDEIDFGIGMDELPYGHEMPVDWDSIPFHAQPEGGHLPQKRLLRKQQQLENLMKAVIKIARDGDKIVDFCSGGGHLGIAIAYLLPKCSIILLDNKEKSLASAKERIIKLGLQNTIIIQSNLDYFVGKFQIGTSLHACGVATDLVMKSCVDSKAAFVVCPCCYGSLKDNHVLEYPRSQLIANSKLSLRDYLILSHCADQVHGVEYSKSSQGEKCMASLDSDRLLYAKENHYEVFISKLVPKSCTPKNNLLVGIPIPTS